MNYEYCDGITHTIKKGDTLYEISRKHNVPLAMLLRANPYVDVFNLQVGDTICVPKKEQDCMTHPMKKQEQKEPVRDSITEQDLPETTQESMESQEETTGYGNGMENRKTESNVTGNFCDMTGWEQYIVYVKKKEN